MALEIERKFLLAGEEWRPLVRASHRMLQGYLNNDEAHCSVRVRVVGSRAFLNIKGATLGAQRHEYEYAIPLADAEHILETLCRRPLIEKTRHLVPLGAHQWEIDEFHGDNAGLVVAEIELAHPDEVFERPPWLGTEVTHDARYYNTSLSRQPYREWMTRAPVA